MSRLRDWARAIKRDVVAVWIAARDPRVPWYVKVLALAVAAYALSPIDLIPDFIPVLGYLDDLIIVPLGLALVVKLIPSELMAEFRLEAALREAVPRSVVGAIAIVVLWVAAAILLLWWLWPSRAVVQGTSLGAPVFAVPLCSAGPGERVQAFLAHHSPVSVAGAAVGGV